MVKKLGAITSVNDIRPHRFRHDFGTTITRQVLNPLHGKELMVSRAIKSTVGIPKERSFQAAELRLLIGDWGRW